MTTKAKPTIGRREFLRTLGTSAGVAAVAAAPIGTAAKADSESADERRKARYQANSPHVQKFYNVNRYPAATK